MRLNNNPTKTTTIRNIIFFLNVFVALMIISSAVFLIKTEFGRIALLFGFLMLAISTILKVFQKW